MRINELQFVSANYLQILRFAERLCSLLNAVEPKLRDAVIVASDAEWCRAFHQVTLHVFADVASKVGNALNQRAVFLTPVGVELLVTDVSSASCADY